MEKSSRCTRDWTPQSAAFVSAEVDSGEGGRCQFEAVAYLDKATDS